MLRFGGFGYRSSDHICFIRGSNLLSDHQDQRFTKVDDNISINLCNDKSYFINALKFIPRLFKLSTNNGSCQFNIQILKDTSSVISNFIKENPNVNEYHIDVDDNHNVLGKFEKLYLGDNIVFEEDELPISKKITGLLNIISLPNYMKPENLKYEETLNSQLSLKEGVGINQNSLETFFRKKSHQTFKIITNNKEYNCNYFGVFSSAIIFELFKKDPKLNQFKFDFDDESDDFQQICNYFNFESIKIKSNNMDILKEMAEDLKIDRILPLIDNFIDKYETFSKTIDEQQSTVDSIEELFGWLFNKQESTVETITSLILKSNWVKTEDDVLELAACIIKAANNSYKAQDFIIDLLFQLDKEADESKNKLHILLPFVCNRFLQSLGLYMRNCSFIYKLYKKGAISKEKLYDRISSRYVEMNNAKKAFKTDRYDNINTYIQMWFLPELIDLKLTKNIDYLVLLENNSSNNKNDDNQHFVKFIKSYYPDNLDLYIKMRDSGEPDDELTKALINDDVDKLQSILSSSNVDYSECVIPFNIFSILSNNGSIKLIDYAAIHGSTKCFKFLYLNHAKINNSTFIHAIGGGNTEIIQIIDQNLSSQKNSGDSTVKKNPSKIIIQSMTRHQNDLFDWTIEHKLSGNLIDKFGEILLKNAVSHGCAYAFIEIIDKFSSPCDYQNLIEIAAKNGFYKFANLIYDIFDKRLNNSRIKSNSSKKAILFKIPNQPKQNDNNNKNLIFNNCFVEFGNLSIFKLGLKLNVRNEYLIEALKVCMNKNYKNIFDYYFNELIESDNLKLDNSFVSKIGSVAITCESNDYLNDLIDKIKFIKPNFFSNFDSFQSLLNVACKNNKIEYVKTLLNLIKENKNDEDITPSFITAANSGYNEICQYMIKDEYFKIKTKQLLSNSQSIGSLNKDIYSLIIDNSSPEVVESFLFCSLYPAIEKENKDLVEFLLNKDVAYDDALIKAANVNNLDIVKLVLKHDSRPSFINKKSPNGTALISAINNNQIEMVKFLLSIPGIEPSLNEVQNKMPLISSITNFNLDIMNLILDFYGENIQSQIWQLDEAIKQLLNIVSPMNNKKDLMIKEKKRKLLLILKRILMIKGIDPNSCGERHTFLSYACESNEIEIVKMLLELERIDVNAYAPRTGNTPLMIAILNNNIDISILLINDKRINVNLRNYDDKTALIFAVENKLSNIVSLLIKNEKFDAYESCLNYAFYISNYSIAEILISTKSVDINFKTFLNTNMNKMVLTVPNDKVFDGVKYFTPLINAVGSKDINKINLIIQYPSFDKAKSQLILAIFYSIKMNNIQIFQILIKLLDNDVNISNDDGFTFLYAAVLYESKDIVEIILNNEKFDYKKSKFLDVFKDALLNVVFNNSVVNMIYDFDIKHNHLIDLNEFLPNGKTFYTSSIDQNRKNKGIDGVKFLLDHGADPNIPDKNNVYPLEIAIISSDYDFVSELLNSEKVDLNRQIPTKNESIYSCYGIGNHNNIFSIIKNVNMKYTSYLHLAAISTSEILQMFLNKNEVNINAEDDLGNTPLMYASLSYREYNVSMLFGSNKNLDHLHRNKNGKDAISLLSNLIDSHKDKSEYEQKLISIIRNFNNSVDLPHNKHSTFFGFKEEYKKKFDQIRSNFVQNLPQINSSPLEKWNTFEKKSGLLKFGNQKDYKEPNLIKNDSSTSSKSNEIEKKSGLLKSEIQKDNKEPNLIKNDSSTSSKNNEIEKKSGIFKFRIPKDNKEKNLSQNNALSFSFEKKSTSAEEDNKKLHKKVIGSFEENFSLIKKKPDFSNRNIESDSISSSNEINKSDETTSSEFKFKFNLNNKDSKITSTFQNKRNSIETATNKNATSFNLEKVSSENPFEKATNKNATSFNLEKVSSENHQKQEKSFKTGIIQRPRSKLEREIESAVTDIFDDISPEETKSVSNSLYQITSKRIKKLSSHLDSDFDDDFDDNFDIQSQIEYQNEMMMNQQQVQYQFQQWQQLIQLSYAKQIQYNMQMLQMQQQMEINATKKKLKAKKRRNKSKK